VLYILGHLPHPVTPEIIFQIADFEDERYGYFDISLALEELVKSGHISETADALYEITEKGIAHGKITEDDIPYSFRLKMDAEIRNVRRVLEIERF